jgi:hypothetical protein
MSTDASAPKREPVDVALEPRDLLVHLRQWLVWKREHNTRHFGESDQSGHPHGYAGVVIPEWDVLQKLEEIDAALEQQAAQSSERGEG